MSFKDLKDYAAIAAIPLSYLGALWAIFTVSVPEFSLTAQQITDYGIRALLALVLTFGMAWGYLYVKIKNRKQPIAQKHKK